MEGLIGIAGGVGPFAGLALQRHILEQTIAIRDQDHVPVLAISRPGTIPDRTEFLLGRAGINPAFPLLAQLRLLSEAGATVAGIPCNTAHAPAIFDVIRTGVARFGRPLRLLNMIDETAAFLRASQGDLRAVGVLSTTGTWRVRLYPAALEPLGYHVVVPDEALQTETIHPAIYDPDYGLKASGRVTERARAMIQSTLSRSGRISTGKCSVLSTSASEMKPASGTPATPMAANMQTAAATSCCPMLRSIPLACATNRRAIPSYKMMPSLFRLVPTQAPRADAPRETPSRSSARPTACSRTR